MPIQRRGGVRWVVPIDGNGCCAGVQFEKPLSSLEVQILTYPSTADPSSTTLPND
jgi:hypothetical protein